MKNRLLDLLKWKGEITRKTFVTLGFLLFAIKYNLDRLVVLLAFGRSWSIFTYFQQPLPGVENASPAQNPGQFATLFLVSIPFLWLGVVLCLKRLRSCGLPLWLVTLFVLPVVKWILFLALALVPERSEPGEDKKIYAVSWMPRSIWGSAALAVAASVALSVTAMVLSTTLLQSYGWALFVGIPFVMGFLSAVIYGAREKRTLAGSLTVACASVALTGVALLTVALEGGVCLVMAAPIALTGAIVGAMAGHAALAIGRFHAMPHLFCLPLLAMPAMLSMERLDPIPAPLLEVATEMEVNAPIHTVWNHVIEFSELPSPTEPIFKLGVAYPIRAEISGHGPGAVRHCVFSTGEFVEPIQKWEEPTLLQFSVTKNPAPLEEWTPYHEIHPPHLHGFLVSEKGQFHLVELTRNATMIIGTTWYRHNMWPASYWQIWSDQIIHAIHHRVLLHIKTLAEKDATQTPAS